MLNEIIDAGSGVPVIWKDIRVYFIPKEDPNDTRPISVGSILALVRLVFIEQHRLVGTNHHAT